jgi:UDP-N-acetylglucosamine--N-acetylmuramyl-(pentapeptide) pyrophosphoryl-undecaprenol N-acetylglucosamine transferase
VFGTGGYVSAPVLMAAKNLKIPYMIHEPDAHPGLVNRLMSRWADKVTAAFIEAKNLLKGRSFHVTGNPIRGKIMEIIDGKLSKEAAKNQLGLSLEPDKKILLVTGGSQGARQINQAIIGAIPTLLDELHLQVIHQTGQKLFEDAMALLPAAYRDHPDYIMRPFFPDMSLTLASADFALCRSGSLTLSEMYLAGLPTILVPYPYAAADHQRKNAMASCKAGASRMIEDTQCTSEHVIAIVQELLNQSAAFEQMKTACTTLAHPYATDEIVGLLKSYGL